MKERPLTSRTCHRALVTKGLSVTLTDTTTLCLKCDLLPWKRGHLLASKQPVDWILGHSCRDEGSHVCHCFSSWIKCHLFKETFSDHATLSKIMFHVVCPISSSLPCLLLLLSEWVIVPFFISCLLWNLSHMGGGFLKVLFSITYLGLLKSTWYKVNIQQTFSYEGMNKLRNEWNVLCVCCFSNYQSNICVVVWFTHSVSNLAHPTLFLASTELSLKYKLNYDVLITSFPNPKPLSLLYLTPTCGLYIKLLPTAQKLCGGLQGGNSSRILWLNPGPKRWWI